MPKRTADGDRVRATLTGHDGTGDEVVLRPRAGGTPRSTGVRRPVPRITAPSRPLPPGTGPGERIRVARVPAGSPRPPVIPRRRPHRRFVLLGVTVVLLTAGLGVYGLISTGFFRVERVDVEGTHYLSADEVARASGALHQELFWVEPESVRQRVERLPGVRRAWVVRRWPHGLTVRVEERVPVAIWQVGGVGYAVDAEGVVLDLTPDEALPVIVQTDGAPGLLPGDHVDGDAVRMALRVRELAPAAVGQQPVRFEWTQARGLEVTTDRGMRVRLGDEAGLEYKLAVWRAILQRAGHTPVTEVDLRFGDRAFYR